MLQFRPSFVAPAILALAVSFGNAVWSAPPVKNAGLKFEGEGVSAFKTTISKATSNANGTPFVSTQSDKESGKPVSTALAFANGTNSSVSALIFDQKREIGKTEHQRGFSLALVARAGFRAGQIFTILAPNFRRRPQTLSCALTYDEIELTRSGYKSLGSKRSKTSRKIRGWIATSGTIRVDAVSAKQISFSVKNARFVVPEPNPKNFAKGVFLANGQGICKFAE